MKEIKVGIVGLGRLGSVQRRISRSRFPAASWSLPARLSRKELDWAKDYL